MYAGTHGQMSLAGAPVFLDAAGHRIPVARWLWRTAVDRQANAGIAFVCSNDPFDRTGRPPCGGGGGGADLCGANGWDALARDRGVFGAYCCTVSQLKEAVPEAGDVDDVEVVLERTAPPEGSADGADDADAAEGDEDGQEEAVVGAVIRRPGTVTAARRRPPKPRSNVRPRPSGVARRDRATPRPVTVL